MMWRTISILSLSLFLIACPYKGEFIQAVYAGDTIRVAEQLRHGANPNQVDRVGRPAVIVAILNERPDIVRMLMKSGANPNTVYASEPAISFAVSQGRCAEKSVAVLLASGANPNVTDPITRSTPLLEAAANGREECVNLLLKAKALASAENRRGENAIWHATLGGNLNILKTFIDLGIDADKPSIQGVTPLMVAAAAGNELIAKVLLGKGVRECAIDRLGRTSQMMATERGHVELARLLSECRDRKKE